MAAQRLDRFLPALMRKHGIDMWVVPMREYNEDPVFTRHRRRPQTFAARRRTIYVFFDTCAAPASRPPPSCVRAHRARRHAAGRRLRGASLHASRRPANVGRGQQAELWGDEQWQVLKAVIEERNPKVIGINRSTVFAFSDGLSSGELQGMSAALGDEVDGALQARRRRCRSSSSPSRLPEEEAFYTAHAGAGVVADRGDVLEQDHHPGHDPHQRPGLVVAPAGQRPRPRHVVPAVASTCSARARPTPTLGDDPVIQRGDVLHCDVGITVARLNTDTQHMAYVLREGETDAPAGLRRRSRTRNGCRTSSMDELRPGRTGNADPRRRAGAHEGEGHRRHDVHAPDRHARPRRRSADRALGLPGRRPRPRRRDGHSRACGSRSSCRRRRRCRSGTASRSGWRRRRTRSSTPTGASAGRFSGRTGCSWCADRPRAGVARGVVAAPTQRW